MGLVKFTLFATILTIIVCLSMLIGIAVSYPTDNTFPDEEIGGVVDEEILPEFNVEVSTEITPNADGKVPEGGVTLEGGAAGATIPEGVQLADGATEVVLTVNSMESATEVELADGESAKSIDVHIEGVAKDNDVPMLVSVKKLFIPGLNFGSANIYHVENGVPVKMTQVSY